MRIQLDWLKEYVDFNITPEELAEVLSMGGLEVEALEWVELPDGEKTRVMEINVTPNRGYCLSYRGVAREVSALLGTPCHLPSPDDSLQQAWGDIPVENRISVENRAPELCPRYSAMVIENVKPGASPKWLADKLRAIGLRPINNIVDITNFVLMEFGQPLHAFDREKLAGSQIVIRRAGEKECFTSLDGTNLVLGEDALVIADAEKPVALAGIMGGANSEVSLSTKNVVLESACFDPVIVRKGSKKYGIRTDSSYRFERGIDLEGVIQAQSRAALLIQELAGGEICRGRVDLYPNPAPLKKVTVRVPRVNQILGTDLNFEQVALYLERLGFGLNDKSGKKELPVEIPSYRPALEREIDLIEEVARIHGFGNIPVTHPSGELTPVRLSRQQETTRKVKEFLSHLGFAEAINYSFIQEENAEKFRKALVFDQNLPGVSLSNPLSADWSTMRTSLIPGLLSTVARNFSKGQKPVKLFEIGDVYYSDSDRNNSGTLEKTSLCALVSGEYEYNPWKPRGRHYDFYDLKGTLESLLENLRMPMVFQPNRLPFLTEGKSVDCLASGVRIGYLGEVSKQLLREWELDQSVFAFELDFSRLVAELPGTPKFQPIPKFPETYRDISVIVDKTVPAQAVYDLILESSAPLIQKVVLYDHFEGKKIEKGKKSLTFSLTFQSPEKTLTDDEVNPVFEKVIQTLSDKLGARLRES